MNTARICVIYYSYEGNTKAIAESISEATGAKLISLKSVNEMESTGFMRYIYGGYKARIDDTPELVPYDFNADDYDLIFIGTPVWWYTLSPTINSFMNKTKFENKNVAIFCTDGGGIGSTFTKMKELLVNNNIVGEKEFVKVLKTQGSTDVAKQWSTDIVNQLK